MRSNNIQSHVKVVVTAALCVLCIEGLRDAIVVQGPAESQKSHARLDLRAISSEWWTSEVKRQPGPIVGST